MGWLDAILYSIIGIFVVWESLAHFVFHNVEIHTLSNRIAWLEKQGGWPVRVLVMGATLAAGLHLIGVF